MNRPETERDENGETQSTRAARAVRRLLVDHANAGGAYEVRRETMTDGNTQIVILVDGVPLDGFIMNGIKR